MKIVTLIPLTSLLLLGACQKSTQSTTSVENSAASFDEWFSDNAPENPQTIHLLRSTAKPGDEVTVSGLVMGRKQPFVDGRAAFVLGDPSKLTPCNRVPGDKCKTPWDVCCDDDELILESTATIQLLVENNRVLAHSIKGAHGLAELSLITLTGTVDKASTAEALIINATRLHVAPQP